MRYLESAALALITVFIPVESAILTTFALILVDLVVGILAARKQKIPVTSEGIKRTVGKILLYETAICLGFLVQQYLTGELFPACKLITALVGLVELKSILENLDVVSGTNTFKAILSRITQSAEDIEKKR